jgi:hypothetical protein
MIVRHAACNCGQLRLACEGEPVRVSVCHCLECQRRTGSVFGVQARFKRDRIAVEGNAAQHARIAESGNRLTFNFCPQCGSTVYWQSEAAADLIAVAVGAFADQSFPAPAHSVWERRRHPWAALPTDMSVQHSD